MLNRLSKMQKKRKNIESLTSIQMILKVTATILRIRGKMTRTCSKILRYI